MKTNFALPVLVLGAVAVASAQGQVPTKVAIIHVQNAILSTKDGQKASGDLQSKFTPKKQELDKKQSDLAALQEQLRKGSATMSEDAKAKLMRDIDNNTKTLQRETQDAQSDLDEEQGKVMQELGNKMMAVVEKYANEHGYAVVLDVSNPQTPVLWASQTVDITNDIVKLYDSTNPGTASAPSAATSAPKPAGAAAPPARSAAPPALPPAKKK
ncbi:MAG TPA: OmpH family outer membrane protein [Bryobacteraceae bacterium]